MKSRLTKLIWYRCHQSAISKQFSSFCVCKTHVRHHLHYKIPYYQQTLYVKKDSIDKISTNKICWWNRIYCWIL